MKKALSLTLLSILLAAIPALAGAQNDDWGLWNGAHVGLNLGGGIGTDSGGTECALAGTLNGTGCPVPGYAQGANTGGFLGGLQLGWDTTTPDRIVFGIEGDIDYSDIQSTPSYSGALHFNNGGSTPGYTINDKATQNWLATLRFRLGLALTPRSLLYVTGGYALAQEALSTRLTGTIAPGFCYCGSTTVTQPGWTEGAGYEWGMGHRMTGRIEFLNYNLRYDQFLAHENIPSPYTYGKDFYFNGDVVRVGVDWKI